MSYSASVNATENLASPFASGTMSSSNSYFDQYSKGWLSSTATNTTTAESKAFSMALLTPNSNQYGLASTYTASAATGSPSYWLRGTVYPVTDYAGGGGYSRGDDICIYAGTTHYTTYHSSVSISTTPDKTRAICMFIRLHEA